MKLKHRYSTAPFQKSSVSLIESFIQRFIISSSIIWVTLLFFFFSYSEINAATYYLKAGSATSPQTLASWGTNTDGSGTSPGSFAAGDDFIISAGVNAELSAAWTVSSSSNVNASLNVNGSLVILTGGTLTISQGGNASMTLIVNNGGVLDLRNTSAAQINAGSSKNQSLTISEGATLKVAHQTGITSAISSTITSTYSTAANYEFSGATQTTAGLPTTVNNLTLSGSGTKTLGNAQTVSGNLSIASGVTFAAGAQSVTVTGNWSNAGTFTSTGTVTFNRNTAGQTQTISGSTFHTVSMTGASGKSASGNLTLTGNLSVAAGSAFSAGAHTHSVAGNWTQSGTFTAGTSTIVFNGGNTTQTMSGNSSFHNLTILKSSGGTVTAAGSTLAVGNVLHVSAGNFTGASSYHHVTIASGATFTAGSGTSTVSGNWINNGTFVANNGTISFTGVAVTDSVQLIGGTSSTTFHGLTMNGTRLKRLGIAITATGNLTMSVGILEILNFGLTVAQTSGGSASSYVMTSDTGRLSITIPATSSRFFPVGNSAYNPMQLTNQSTTQTEVFRVRVSDSPATNANNVAQTVQRRWYASKISAGSTPVQATLYFNESSESGAAFDKAVSPAVGYYSGLFWAYESISPEQVITNGDEVSFTAAGTINNSNEDSFMVVGSGSAFNATKLLITVSPSSPQLGAGGGIITISSINDQDIPTWLKSATTVRVDPVNIINQGLDNRATGFTTPLTTNFAEGIIAVNSYMTEITEVSFITATTEYGGPSQLSASVVTTDPPGELLTASLSAPFAVISGAIYEPTVSGNWTSIVWRKSVDGGLSWVLSNDSEFGFVIPTNFNATELVRIPDGITLTANVTATFYSFYIETGGELDLVSGGALTLLHPDGNLSGYDLHVHGVFRNSGGTFFNKDYGDTTNPDPQTAQFPTAISGANYPIEIHGGTYIHARNGGTIPLAEWESLGEIRSHCIVTGITTTALSSGLNQHFEDFTWDNSAQSVVQTLNGNLQVQGILTLGNGVITTGIHQVIKNGNGNVNRSGGHIHGNFRYYVPTGEFVTVLFPVGDASVYAPVDISFTDIAGNGYVDVSTVAAQPVVASALRQDQYVNRKWTMNSNGLNFSGYSPTFTFVESDRVGLTEASVLTVRKLSNSIWYTTGASSVTNSITATGLTSFSDFYVGVSACSETNYFWLGSVDSDWHTAGNWCRNEVPTSTTDVTIPGGITRYPVISNAASVFNIWILSESSLTVQGTPVLSVYGDWSNQGTFAAGSGMVTFAGAASQQIIGVTNFHHLTIDNPSGGVEAQNNITVNGILNALSANPSTTKGALHTGSHVLYMGATATNTGAGDVTGTITRNHAIQLNTFYTFGHPHTGSRFLVGVELPTSISLRVTIGDAPDWVPKSIMRTYEPAQVGGVNMRVYSKFHYKENELPAGLTSVEESTLSVWLKSPDDDNNFLYFDRGWSDYDIADNWVAISDDNFTTLPSSIGDLVITLSPTSNSVIVWEGSVSSDWTDANNWSGDNNLPTQNDIVIIPDSTTTLHDPVLPSSASNAEAKALVVQAGGVLEGGNGQLTIFNGNVANAWQLETARLSFDAAVFNAGTSTIVFNSQTTFATIGGNTSFHTFAIPAGSKVLIGDDAYVGITGALLLDANGVLDAASTHNFVEYKGDNQLIVNPNYDSFPGYHNLTISGSGVKTLPSVLNMTCNFTNNGTVDALLNQSNIIFNTGVHNKPMLIKGSSPTTFHKLTVNNLHGVTAQQNLTIVNELSLQSMNLSNKGALHIETGKILSLQAQAVVTGNGDATGVVSRSHVFQNNVFYSLTGTNTFFVLSNLPNQSNNILTLNVKLSIGEAAPWEDCDGYGEMQFPVRRIITYWKDGDWGDASANFRLAYHTADLPDGIIPDLLTFWVKTNNGSECNVIDLGKSNQDVIAKFLGIANILMSSVPDVMDVRQVTLAQTSETVNQWLGAQNTLGTNGNNWTLGAPIATQKLFVPAANSTPNVPTFPNGLTVKAIQLQQGAIVNVADGDTITLTGDGIVLEVPAAAQWNVGTGSVVELNSGTLSSVVGNVTFQHLLVNEGTTLFGTNGNIITIMGSLINNGSISAQTNNNTFNFAGNGQTVPNTTSGVANYRNLLISGSNTTLPANLNMNGTLTLGGIGTVMPTAELQLQGNFIYSGSGMVRGNGEVRMNGMSAQQIGGTGSPDFHDLVIDNAAGVTLTSNGRSNVAGTLTINSGKKLILAAGKQLHAASVANIAGAGGLVVSASANQPNATFTYDGSGTVPATVQLYTKGSLTPADELGEEIVPAYYNWQYIGVPVTGVQKFNPMLSGSFMAQFNEVRRDYDPVPAELEPFRGYALTQSVPRTFNYEGPLVKGAGTDGAREIALSFTGDEHADKGFNLIANSFTTPVAIADITFTNTTPVIYLFNTGSNIGESYGDAPGQYLAVPSQLASDLGVTHISSLQGFYVQATGSEASVTLPYNTMVANSSPMRMTEQSQRGRPRTIIEVKGEDYSDRVWLFTQPGTSKGYDAGWDGRKLDGISAAPRIYAMGGGERWQVSTSADINQTVLGFRKGAGRDYVINFSHYAVDDVYPNMYLVDMHAQRVIPVEADGASYHFTEDRAMATERFMIVTSMDDVLSAATVDAQGLRAYFVPQGIMIENPGIESGSLQVYDMMGRRVLDATIGGEPQQVIGHQLPAGTYILRLMTSGGNISTNRMVIR